MSRTLVSRALVVAAVAVTLVVGLVYRQQLVSWFTGRDRTTVGGSGPKALGGVGRITKQEAEAPALPAVEFQPPAFDALGRALAATEQVRVELAASSLDGVAAPAVAAAQAVREVQLAQPAAVVDSLARGVTAAEQLARATELSAARHAFGDLNRELIALATADPRLQQGWHLFRCPMTEGFQKWFQRPAALDNPYMGEAMPTCGSASTWEPAATDDAKLSHEGHGHEGSDTSFYTCAMHTSVREQAPGKCPICSMDLSGVTYDQEESGSIFVAEARRNEIGIRTSKVVRAPMTRSIRAVGRVAYDESRLADVTLKLSGFISKLHVTETGQRVKKGQVLFTLYSPELYAAQQEYVLARDSHTEAGSGRGDYLVRAAEKKLELWGLSRGQIDAIARRGKPLEDVPFVSPTTGYVIEKKVVEGAAVQVGERLFRIAALDRVWVEAEVYEGDLAAVKRGQRAVVTLNYQPGQSYDGTVAFVYPYLDPATRTGKVRIELPNANLELKPDMYATIAFEIALGPRLQIPIGAVVYTGPRRLVFVDLGEGRLRPQEVTLGVRSVDLVEVVAGLREGQMIVTAGNFLVAAESRIRSNAKFWTEPQSGSAAAPVASPPARGSP